jgi:predicted acylesterase/phospholipase RssA
MSEIIESGLMEGGFDVEALRWQIDQHLRGNEKGETLRGNAFEKHQLKTAGFLGGGAWYGLQHIGALESAEEKGIEFDELIGSSVGSLVGAIHRIDPRKLKDRSNVRGFTDAFQLNPSLRSTHDEKVLRDKINHCIDGATFEDCKKGMHIAVTDVTHHRSLILNKQNYKGKVIDAIMASAAIPGVYRPYFMRQLSDGTFDWAKEEEYFRGSDVFMVQDGSIGGDMPIQTLRSMIPNIDLCVGIQVIPGVHVMDHVHENFKAILQRGAEMAHEGREAMRKVIPHSDRMQTLQRLKSLGGKIPGALAHTAATFAFGSQLHRSYGQFKPENNEFLIRPQPKKLVNPIGRPSYDSQDAMIEAGREGMDRGLQTLPILEHVARINNHNDQLAQILSLREEVGELAKSA